MIFQRRVKAFSTSTVYRYKTSSCKGVFAQLTVHTIVHSKNIIFVLLKFRVFKCIFCPRRVIIVLLYFTIITNFTCFIVFLWPNYTKYC